MAQYLWKIVQKYLHRWSFKENYRTLTSHDDIQRESLQVTSGQQLNHEILKATESNLIIL